MQIKEGQKLFSVKIHLQWPNLMWLHMGNLEFMTSPCHFIDKKLHSTSSGLSPNKLHFFKRLGITTHQAPVVQRVDSAIQWINYYPLDNAINFDGTYLLDSDLPNG